MRRWEPLNDRQRAVLRQLADDPDGLQDAGFRISANALLHRGLVTINRSKGQWEAFVTEAGEFYLAHGHHPDHPAHAGESSASRPPVTRSARRSTAGRTKRKLPLATEVITEERRQAATELLAKLVQQRTVLIEEPSEDEVTRWRQVVDFAKRHAMEPAGYRIQKQQTYEGLELSLVAGLHANSRPKGDEALDEIPIPTQLRSPHPAVASLRDDKFRLIMLDDFRQRCLLILQALADAAIRRGHEVRPAPVPQHRRRSDFPAGHPGYVQRDGEIEIVAGGFGYVVTIQQECPESDDSERYQRLVVSLTPYQAEGRQYRWADRKRWRVEQRLAAVLLEIETRAREDQQRKLEEERAAAERKVRWELAMDDATSKAAELYYANALTEQLERWRLADKLRGYYHALEARVQVATKDDDPQISSAKEWLDWVGGYVERLDPLVGLPTMPPPPQLTKDDLVPFLGRLSPNGPDAHRDRWGRY